MRYNAIAILLYGFKLPNNFSWKDIKTSYNKVGEITISRTGDTRSGMFDPTLGIILACTSPLDDYKTVTLPTKEQLKKYANKLHAFCIENNIEYKEPKCIMILCIT